MALNTALYCKARLAISDTGLVGTLRCPYDKSTSETSIDLFHFPVENMYNWRDIIINPYSAQLNNLNFHSLEVVGRASETQLQVGENYSYSVQFVTKRLQILMCEMGNCSDYNIFTIFRTIQH